MIIIFYFISSAEFPKFSLFLLNLILFALKLVFFLFVYLYLFIFILKNKLFSCKTGNYIEYEEIFLKKKS